MNKYNPQRIEKKWQEKWYKSNIFKAKNKGKNKFYLLFEFPYPSGDGLHVGHCRPYIGLDVIARKKRMEGFNLLFPIGWDAFGLPTENYAIKKGIHPSLATKKNTDNFRRQMKLIGLSLDWSREINTTDPKYYKWTQWIFIKLFENGLAYKDKIDINWCPSCKIGLANEEVVGGKCERCETAVEKKEKEQWLIKITKYADRLLKDLDLVDYPERVKVQQKEWIGRSEGVNEKNRVKGLDIEFETYDSIPQTFMAQTFTVIAPDHPLLKKLVEGTEYEKPVLEFAKKIIEKRMAGSYENKKNIEGIFTGRYVENFCGIGRDLPIWIASYVVLDYGTGIVNCSAHDEWDFAFAKKYGIPLHPVLFPKNETLAKKVKNLEIFYREPDGILQEPDKFRGLTWDEARQPVIKYLEEKGFGKKAVQYKLRDWVFSRQHYWGEPIPMIFCDNCRRKSLENSKSQETNSKQITNSNIQTQNLGWIPVPEKDLPVELPKVKKYQPTNTGQSPLAQMVKWVNIKCPKCKDWAKRETDTMPNWAGSNWYYLRYADPKNNKKLAEAKLLKYWLPVDWYNGGMEHTTLHLLYSRFIFKFLWDIGAVPKSIGPEPYKKRTSHGVILGQRGVKMSKSKGNVINPDDVVRQYGADTLRTYQMFMGPFEQTIPWDSKSIIGCRRFLAKVHNLFQSSQELWNKSKGKIKKPKGQAESKNLTSLLNKTVKKVGQDIEAMKFNTALSAMMEFTNAWQVSKSNLGKKDRKNFLIIISPFAPHLAEEIWDKAGFLGQLSQQKWPKYDEKLGEEKEVTFIVQINGKVRAKIEISRGILQSQAEAIVTKNPKIQQLLIRKQVKKFVFVPNKLINIVAIDKDY